MDKHKALKILKEARQHINDTSLLEDELYEAVPEPILSEAKEIDALLDRAADRLWKLQKKVAAWTP